MRIGSVDAYSVRGRPVMSVDAARLASRFGAPVMGVQRSALHARLAEGLPNGIFRFGAAFTRLHDDGDSVRAETEDGAEYAGDLLIGADGIRSQVRPALLGAGSDARPTGTVTWQGMIPAPFPIDDRARLFLGRHGDIGLNPPRRPAAVVLQRRGTAGRRHRPSRSRPRDPPGTLHEMGRARPGTAGHPLAGRFRVLPAPPAAHPAPVGTRPVRPDRGRGANDAAQPGTGRRYQGLEDVAALLRVLGTGTSDLPAALRTYENSRLPRSWPPRWRAAAWRPADRAPCSRPSPPCAPTRCPTAWRHGRSGHSSAEPATGSDLGSSRDRPDGRVIPTGRVLGRRGRVRVRPVSRQGSGTRRDRRSSPRTSAGSACRTPRPLPA